MIAWTYINMIISVYAFRCMFPDSYVCLTCYLLILSNSYSYDAITVFSTLSLAVSTLSTKHDIKLTPLIVEPRLYFTCQKQTCYGDSRRQDLDIRVAIWRSISDLRALSFYGWMPWIFLYFSCNNCCHLLSLCVL